MSVPLISTVAFVSILSALISLTASIATWRRSTPGASSLSLLLLGMAIWAGGYATRWMQLTPDIKIFWFKVMYLGVVAVPTLFLVFAMAVTHNERWINPRHMTLLAIQPATSLVLHWTNEAHSLFYRSVSVIGGDDPVVIALTRGPWYFVHIVYSYAVIGIAFVLLSHGALRLGPLYRSRYPLILAASLLPWVTSVFTELTFATSRIPEITPLTFGLTALLFTFAILSTHFRNLIPVARSHLIENMCDGVMVLDAQNRVVDLNPAMERLLEQQSSYYLGKNAPEVFDSWLQKVDPIRAANEAQAELQVPGHPPRYLDLRVTPLYDREGLLNGRLMVFRDVTERKQDEKRLRYANERLQTQLIEIGLLQSKLREQAIRDPLTNLFNRRYLEETLDRELARAGRESYPVCIIMIDLDYFKKINDTYGHDAGDQVLRVLANTLSEQSRRGDFACRYGGEEFVVVMPNISRRTAYERAKKLRRHLNALQIPYERHRLTTTLSMGIACYPANGETRQTLLHAADLAMYAAKKAGRDHILTYDQLRLSEETQQE